MAHAASTAALALAMGGLLGLTPADAGAEGRILYQWVDDHGVVRYTSHRNRVPRSHRSGMQEVLPGATNHQNAELLPGARLARVPDVAAGIPEAPAPPALRDLDERIASLEAEIARDEETLKSLISAPESGEEAPLRDSEALRTIASRLPALQAELNGLREERAAFSQEADDAE